VVVLGETRFRGLGFVRVSDAGLGVSRSAAPTRWRSLWLSALGITYYKTVDRGTGVASATLDGAFNVELA
jgi:hypothetical protein